MNFECVPDNTRKSMKWAVKAWNSWANFRKEKLHYSSVIEMLKLILMLISEVNKCEQWKFLIVVTTEI